MEKKTIKKEDLSPREIAYLEKKLESLLYWETIQIENGRTWTKEYEATCSKIEKLEKFLGINIPEE